MFVHLDQQRQALDARLGIEHRHPLVLASHHQVAIHRLGVQELGDLDVFLPRLRRLKRTARLPLELRRARGENIGPVQQRDHIASHGQAVNAVTPAATVASDGGDEILKVGGQARGNFIQRAQMRKEFAFPLIGDLQDVVVAGAGQQVR